jgi:hypothetical protein
MKRLITAAVVTAFIATGVVYAQKPKPTVNPAKHPNLAAAQTALEKAFQKITDAQQANEFDLGGHAAKAKDLIDQANKELKQAAAAAGK